jgi:hypothetical protein
MSSSVSLAIKGSALTLTARFLVGSLLLYLATALYSFYRPGLRDIPGPRLAALSRLWNVFNVAQGNAPQNFRKLHEKYGNIYQ